MPAWRTYWGLGDLYTFFSDCVYFEPATIYRSRPGFTFFNSCGLDHFHAKVLNIPCEYANKVIGFDALASAMQSGTKWYYRVGYCPVVFLGEFAMAKTLLYPGFDKTPEYGLLPKASMDQRQKDEMKTKAEAQTFDALMSTFDFSLIKWFHDNGIPQVVSLDQTVFDRSL